MTRAHLGIVGCKLLPTQYLVILFKALCDLVSLTGNSDL
jgi:hypothetical protein